MNVLNEPTAPAAGVGNAAIFFPKGCVTTVVGQVLDRQLGFAGRIGCTLRLSIGDLALRANRDTLPLHIGNGDWARLELMHRHDDDPALHVINAIATSASVGETSWLPVALYHRNAAMSDLRRLVSSLEPALQGVFLGLMLDRQLQRQFFWRPAAADHHCYPGGLFDQSVTAARVASEGEGINARDRGLVTLASLLFDIGKAGDARLLADRPRADAVMQPHTATSARMKDPLRRLAQLEPVLGSDLSALHAATAPAPVTPRVTALREHVRRAVRLSWGPDHAFLTTNHSGAQA